MDRQGEEQSRLTKENDRLKKQNSVLVMQMQDMCCVFDKIYSKFTELGYSEIIDEIAKESDFYKGKMN